MKSYTSGKISGRYILDYLIGQGSMGQVWKSIHPDLHIPVAVKTFQFSSFDKQSLEDQLKRFYAEAKMISSLDHPNIIKVFEVGTEINSPFIVMEYMDGGSLRDRLEHHPAGLAERELLCIAVDISKALSKAMEYKIIHRDIKPDNILIDSKGNLKLADLGIAKEMDSENSLTLTGQAMGTPHYISPEQIMGKFIPDHRSDIYSLGATLYHLATGVPPFSGTSQLEIMMKHVQDPLIPPQKIKAGLSEGFCAVICKMMEKNPHQRYSGYQHLLKDLEAVKNGAPVSVLEARPAIKRTDSKTTVEKDLSQRQKSKRFPLFILILLISAIVATLYLLPELIKKEISEQKKQMEIPLEIKKLPGTYKNTENIVEENGVLSLNDSETTGEFLFKWTNQKGESWNLHPDFKNRVLIADESFPNAKGDSFKVFYLAYDINGRIHGIRFMNSLFLKVL